MKRLLTGTKQFYPVVLYFSDIIMFFLSFVISYWIFYPVDSVNMVVADLRFFIFSLLILLINFTTVGLYKDKRTLFDDTEFMKILSSIIIALIIVIISSLLFGINDIVLYITTILTFIISFILLTHARFLLSKIIFTFRKIGYDQKRVFFYGKLNKDFVEKVRENPALGYKIVGSTNSLAELKNNLKKTDIVFITGEKIDDTLLTLILQNTKINWKIISSVLNLVIDPVDFDEFKDYPIINVSGSKHASKYLILKRMLDILLSGSALLLLSPLLILIAILVKLSSKGHVFFKHERLGKNLRPFLLYKFRTMRQGSDKDKDKLKNEVKGLFKMKDDPRVTAIGKFLRRTCLDEVPQLINILFGDMSIVGPRPHLQRELDHFKGWRMLRFRLKPGLTGLWQVSGRHELNFDKAVLYDIYYIQHMSLFLDFTIILKTIPAIVFSKGRF